MDTISKICFVEKKLGETFEDQFLKNTYQFFLSNDLSTLMWW
jgi:hypothetical protein